MPPQTELSTTYHFDCSHIVDVPRRLENLLWTPPPQFEGGRLPPYSERPAEGVHKFVPRPCPQCTRDDFEQFRARLIEIDAMLVELSADELVFGEMHLEEEFEAMEVAMGEVCRMMDLNHLLGCHYGCGKPRG